MRRLDALRAIKPVLDESVVVTIMGAVAAELQSLGHRPNWFYLQHAMGLASSVGLGIALTRPEQRVIVLDGDGSVLMNLGGLTTLARYRPANLVHVVFDNGSLLSVGGFPTATTTGTDLAAVARGAGVPHALTVDSPDALAGAVREAVESDTLTTIVAKVEAHYEPPAGTAGFVTNLTLLENRFQFARWLEAAAAGTQAEPPRDSGT
jgi:sulfopyruvate decarboxylase subunit beta